MDIKVFAKFDEIPSLPVQDNKEKANRRRDGKMDNVQTVYRKHSLGV